MSTTLAIRNLEEPVKQMLRMQAASHGRSMQAEARDILTAAVRHPAVAPTVTAVRSDAQITAYQPGGLLINCLIYTELCTDAATTADVDKLLAGLKLELRGLSREALFLAAKASLTYRRQGGNKIAPLPDFFVGAHAQVLGIPILTCDAGRYTSYFPRVRLICP